MRDTWEKEKKNLYSKCPKILYTKISDRMAFANGVEDPHQSDQGLHYFAISLCILRNIYYLLHKKQNLDQKKYGIKCSKFLDIYLIWFTSSESQIPIQCGLGLYCLVKQYKNFIDYIFDNDSDQTVWL